MIRKIVFLLFVVCCSASIAFAQEQKAEDKAKQDEMMKKMMELASPGEPHKMLANLVGTWDLTVKSYMDPSAPTESKGTATFKPIMDGRYIHEDTQGNFMDMTFQGMGIYGYDNITKQYVGTWVDNMGTGIMTSTGTSPDGGKTINWTGKSSDAMTGKQQTYRSAMHMKGKDQYHFEMHGPGPDGKEMKMMEITYNRRR